MDKQMKFAYISTGYNEIDHTLTPTPTVVKELEKEKNG